MNTDPNITDWITAGAAVFAAIGTVSAVVVALWQVRRQGKRSLVVKCSSAVIANVENVHVVALRGTNDGSRPIKLTMAYLMTDDGQQVVSLPTAHSDKLPKTLLDGESVDIFWTRDNLNEIKAKEDFNYLYVFFIDVLGNVYRTPYPGVAIKRRGIRRRLTYVLPQEASSTQA